MDAKKAEEYLDKKKKGRPDKPLEDLPEVIDANQIVDKTDVLKAMETVESSVSNGRKKTPPADSKKKDLIR